MDQSGEHAALRLIRRRATRDDFDSERPLDEALIRALIEDATCAPSSFNIQHWRFIAVRSPQDKARLCEAAYNQQQVLRAGVTFIVLGDTQALEQHASIMDTAVERGAIAEGRALAWRRMAREIYDDPAAARDEAIRSASLASMTLMLAAEARGLASGALTGFDAERVMREFGIGSRYLPVMLLAVGHSGGAEHARMPRLPVDDVLFYDRWPES